MTAAGLDEIAASLGVRDEAAIVTEPFRQWVIGDRFAGPRPRREVAGTQLVADVTPFDARGSSTNHRRRSRTGPRHHASGAELRSLLSRAER